ncbi:hypothetical protein niasHT_004797 [Heterodera trifolii]|uniref:Mic1 domain-containing protein n=1 Tax=Heterodera trifolii TaxID=157864 RepID=A0ABD2M9K7_9BILA
MLTVGENISDLRTNETTNIGIFYDCVIGRVCTIKVEGEQSTTTISVKSTEPTDDEILFDIREKCGRVRAVGFAPDVQIVSIQQEDSVIEFVLLQEGKVVGTFWHNCTAKGAVVLGVHWLSNSQVAFVTDLGCEFFCVYAYKRTLKMTQRLAMAIQWFSFYATSNLFVCASGVQNNLFTFVTFQQNVPHILGTAEVDFGYSSAKPRLLERDIAIASIYGKLCILVLNFESVHGFATGLSVYELVPSEPQKLLKLNCLLGLHLVGLVGLHVVDNLVLVHHKNVQSTLIFDLKLCTDRPICSTKLCLPSVPNALSSDSAIAGDGNENKSAGDLPHNQQHANRVLSIGDAFLYNSAWKMCMPDVVVDLQHELFTRVQLQLESAEHALTGEEGHDLDFLIRFLINRRNGEKVLLELLQRAILHKSLQFSRITQIFRQILPEIPTENAESSVTKVKWLPQAMPFLPLTVSHNSLLRTVFEPLFQRGDEVDKRNLANLMMEFFLILKQKHIKVQETYVSELLVKILVAADMFDRLQQLLQYSVIEKSKFLAYELIALSSRCPPLYQIGLDMLKRRNDWEQIVEVLMTRGNLLEALRLLLKVQMERTVFSKTLRRLLDLTWKSDDRQLMFTVFSHLLHVQGRKQLAEVMSSDDFERYDKEFKLLYDKSEVEEAAQRFREARLSSIRRRSDTYAARNDSFTSVSVDAEDSSGSNSGGGLGMDNTL